MGLIRITPIRVLALLALAALLALCPLPAVAAAFITFKALHAPGANVAAYTGAGHCARAMWFLSWGN